MENKSVNIDGETRNEKLFISSLMAHNEQMTIILVK
jgi:hypothetical protein